MKRWIGGAAMLLAVAASQAATRVALLDFSTDDNSYRSIEAAANFTSLVQVGLADEPGFEWVERSQIHLAKTEIAMAELKAAGGLSPVQRGRMLGADWTATGHFSSDDRERPTLSFQLIELGHADVIASGTVRLPVMAEGAWRFGTNQAELAVASLRRLLAEARTRENLGTNQARVAFLFFAGTTGFSFGRGASVLGRELAGALERLASTNRQLRLVNFPKAYQATEEAERLVDGIIGSAHDSWRQTADLYVWGRYAITNTLSAGRRESRLLVEMNLWDGAGQPVVINESVPAGMLGEVSADQLNELVSRFTTRILASARRAAPQPAPVSVRREIAASIVKAYVGMTGRGQANLALHDQAKFVEAVHMLETACFFDPDNADARLLWLTCRYGWWIDFGFEVKNQFWTKWRRSRAWNDYVERFGLKPGRVELPFPFDRHELATTYLDSLEDALEGFPQWHSAEEMALEAEWRREGVHTSLMEAEFHGFPKDMPHELAMQWRRELEVERWTRLTKVVAFIESGDWTPPDKMPSLLLSGVVRHILESEGPPSARLTLLEGVWPACVKCARKFGAQWVIGAGELADETDGAIAKLCAQAGRPERADQLRLMLLPQETAAGTKASLGNRGDAVRHQTNVASARPPAYEASEGHPSSPQRVVSAVVESQFRQSPIRESPRVPTPGWMKDWMSLTKLFRLYPPNVLPVPARVDVHVIPFPPRYEVQVVRQMEWRDGKVWMLAMDERSAPTSAAKPDLAGERREETSRLWVLESEETQPALFPVRGLLASINTMLFRGDELWLAGDGVVVMNLRDATERKFGAAEGLTLREVEALAVAGGSIFVAGDDFELSVFDSASARWSRVPRPMALGGLQHGTGDPYVLTANESWLGYVAGIALFRELNRGVWTNLAPVNNADGFAAEHEHFWVGGKNGLQRVTPGTAAVQSWSAPRFLESPFLGIVGNPFFTGNSEIATNQLEQAEKLILDCLQRFEATRPRAHAIATNRSEPADPFQMSARIPGAVAALVNDGEFLWLGVDNYFGSYLLLLHKPSLSLVAGHTMGVRERISSLALSDQYVWAGTAYGDHALLRMRKDSFLSVPRSQWVSLTITPEQRLSIVQGMSRSDQALYAFYARNHARVVTLLKGLDSEKAGLQEMLLLLWSNDASAADDPIEFRAWSDRIAARCPDSPWSRYVAGLAQPNEAAHAARQAHTLALAKFDRNHDGQLDAAETRAKNQDPEFAKVQNAAAAKQLLVNMAMVIQRYDADGDEILSRSELETLRQGLNARIAAKKSLPNFVPRTQYLTALLSEEIPTVAEVLKRFDANKDAELDVKELVAWARAVRPQ